MEKSSNDIDLKDFLDTSLDIKDSKIRYDIIKKLEAIKQISEKMAQLKNMVDDKNLKIKLLNQNIGRLQIKVDALKNEVTSIANEPEKVVVETE